MNKFKVYANKPPLGWRRLTNSRYLDTTTYPTSKPKSADDKIYLVTVKELKRKK